MKKVKEVAESVQYGYAAVDQDFLVFAGFEGGYPIWSMNMESHKEIAGEKHLNALRGWFPNKQIELIKL